MVNVQHVSKKRKKKKSQMLTPKINNCVDCNQIPNLLYQIDCALFDIARKYRLNNTLLLNKRINRDSAISLLHYKRILTYKLCNEDYLKCFSVEDIANQVKLHIHK